jgi:nucleoside-diphosphate-sugar epimerase
MRVFVAGASGAVGRPLIRQLVEAGHEVTGMTRTPEKARDIEASGATPAVCDAFDAQAVRSAVDAAAPEAVICQLTRLPADYDIRKIDYEPTNRLRLEGGRILLDAAISAGTRRFVTQSIAFLYAPEGEWVKDEEARPFTDAPQPFGSATHALLEHERDVLESGLDGVVLRYGQFYGPGTYYAADGSIAGQVRRRRLPIVGAGGGRTSFVHVEDAAGAAVATAQEGPPGIYNVVDDEPAAFPDWLPHYAEVLGARPPRRVPAWLARIVAGGFAVTLATELRGASNAKAKRELGWAPRYPSWRQGFREALG